MKKQHLTFEELFAIIKGKIAAREKNSYTYEIAKQGVKKTTRKVGEEAVEVLVAAFLHDKNRNKKMRADLVGELCDLFYHSLILMAQQDIEIEEIMQEFELRNKKYNGRK